MRKGLVFWSLLLGALPAWATTIVSRSTEQMFHDAQVVAVAQVRDVRTERQGGRIVTHAILELSESFKGPGAGKRVEVLVPGGVVGEWAQRVEGAPVLAIGERCVVFLSAGGGGLYRFTGLEQGKLTVEGASPNQLMLRRTVTARWVDPSGLHEAAAPPLTEPLKPYLDALRKLAGGAR
jgi:hypothetical protein